MRHVQSYVQMSYPKYGDSKQLNYHGNQQEVYYIFLLQLLISLEEILYVNFDVRIRRDLQNVLDFTCFFLQIYWSYKKHACTSRG